MSLKYALFTFCIFINILVFGQEYKEVSMDELNRELENPLAKYWSLVMQDNWNFNNGNAVEGTYNSNVFNFQPSLPPQ